METINDIMARKYVELIDENEELFGKIKSFGTIIYSIMGYHYGEKNEAYWLRKRDLIKIAKAIKAVDYTNAYKDKLDKDFYPVAISLARGNSLKDVTSVIAYCETDDAFYFSSDRCAIATDCLASDIVYG